MLVGKRLMLVTCAASFSVASALTVTVAGWPTLTLLMLDSLIGTTSCIPLTSIRSMNPELVFDELVELLDDPPEAPLWPPEPPVEEPDDEAADVLPVAEPLPETVSPTAPDTDATVPAKGAYSFVSLTACWALVTAASAVCTLACADERFAAWVAALAAVLAALGLEPLEDPVELDAECAGVVVAGAVVFGVVMAGVVLGVVVVGVFLVVVVVVFVVVVVIVVVVCGAFFFAETTTSVETNRLVLATVWTADAAVADTGTAAVVACTVEAVEAVAPLLVPVEPEPVPEVEEPAGLAIVAASFACAAERFALA